MFKKGNNLNTSTQQRASLGRFAALVTDSIKDTDQDDFIPTTQKRYSEVITTTTTTTKRKLANSSTNANTFEKKRTKKSSLFSDVVSVSSINLQANNTSSPPPPWLDLPTEIIQHIFSYIPIKPLITQIAGVCRKWYNVIRDEKFLRWAKIHLRYEYEEIGTLRMIDQMINPSDNILQSILQQASTIINDNIMNEKTIQFKFSMSILIQLNKRLQKHSVYQYAIDLLSKNKLQQQFQLLNSHEKIFNPLCTTTAISQDLTPAVTDIVNSQRVSKILVGDKHQQIYAFRGAVDAMMKIQSTVTYYLTKSFRFGYDIAFMSNLILQKLCNEKKYLVGNNKSSCLDGRSASIENIVNEQKAYLFRTNYSLFNCAVQLIIEKGLKNVGFVGGKEAMGFDRILDIFYLWLDPEERRKKNYQIRDPQIQSFQSFKTFEKFSLEEVNTGYLKLYQLSKPQIQLYDCLFVDEAQDLTPAVTDIVNSQRVSKILVGDKHQQIYAFRGAVDAMMKIQSTVTYYLTKSFRFGYDIAFISNLILQKLCNEKKYLVGNNKSSCLDGRSASIENIVNEQKAYLFRTNYSLFNCAVQLIIEKGLKNVGFVGGKEAMGFDRILDIFYLWLDPEERRKKNYQIRDPQIQSFQSFKTFEKFSLEVADTELIGKIKLVQSHGHSLIDKIKQLQEKSCSDINQASTKKKQTRFILSIKKFYLEIVLSTAHKAKGLEFPIVILADDFLPRSSDVTLDKISLDVQRENLNILYVATTRATKELILNMDLFYLLYKMCREPAYDLSFSSQTEQCASCAIESDSPEIKNEILFKIKQIQLSSNTITAGEYSPLPNCVKHLSQSFVSITQLYQNV
ncbi:unnamed protein product [Adineta steineri]|uniref:F-box domain-containing protein n=1 Tax=Adineta steineri TaxID=433720 RepID=A0A814IGM9_9BILA|nr:unnamed protein product [Adineta steineri]